MKGYFASMSFDAVLLVIILSLMLLCWAVLYLYASMKIQGSESLTNREKRKWMRAIFFLPFFGCIYFIFFYKKRTSHPGMQNNTQNISNN